MLKMPTPQEFHCSNLYFIIAKSAVRENWLLDQTWEAKMDDVEREGCYRLWKKAVSRTFDWV